MNELVIIGAGGFGREVCAWALQSSQYNREWVVKGFLDDNPAAMDGKGAYPSLIGSVQDYRPQRKDLFVCAIGTPHLKRKCSSHIESRGGVFTNVFHRSVVFAENVLVGAGTIICPNAVISANAKVGRHVGINLHATIDHDVSIGDWSQINCHCDVTGGVTMGSEVFLGSSVSILPGIRIGSGAQVGAGAVVTKDVLPLTTVAGVPARIRKENE